MPLTSSYPGCAQFDQFQLDLKSGVLQRSGVRVPVQAQPLQVLRLLLQAEGKVVTREELRKVLWPEDTFVDFELGVNTAVKKLRQALADPADRPKFIETLPRIGYRFLVPVEWVTEDGQKGVPERVGNSATSSEMAASHAKVHVEVKENTRWPWLAIAAAVLAIAVVAFGVVVAYRWHRPHRSQELAVLTAVPLTALPGREISPAFSPDGSRIAFAWNGDSTGEGKGFDLYVKVLGSETLLRLTRHPSEWISAAWSPDGTQIAFHRLDGADTGIYVIPALGGSERKLLSTRLPGGWTQFSIISWSPDGKWLALADVLPEEGDVAGRYLLSTETLETKQIPNSPECMGEGLPAFSHNGEYLAYWCLRTAYDAVLYSLLIRGGHPKIVSSFQAFPTGLTWSADDERLIYSLNSLGSLLSDELGEVTVENGSTKQLASVGNATLPTVSSKGNKLAYSSIFTNSEIWRRDLLQPKSPAVKLIPSSRAQWDAQYSPDGKRIAIASKRSGLQGVWISSDDGTNLVQISNPNYVSGSPQWSPDGNKIAFDSHPGEHWEIFVADVSERKPRKLVTNVSNITRPHWSGDGMWIYFNSMEPGSSGIYRCPASGGDAVLLSKGTVLINPRESFDGKTVYFANNHDKSTLKQVALPAQPDTESKVDGMPRIRAAELWTLSRAGIYFVPDEAPRSLRYFDFATRQVHPIFEVDKDFSGGLSVSPDGRWILYSQYGDVNSDIMLVDHFH
jgi:Tol biopolymer transport system component/DNA-binding winged helix-turn-helix (wHTH) protein